MEAIENLGKNKTIILIAHRLSTVKKCDKIFLVEKGKIKKEGIFEELITNDYKFQ
jgi:ABC-type multidrug transport system fused ATPase/permease subunit